MGWLIGGRLGEIIRRGLSGLLTSFNRAPEDGSGLPPISSNVGPGDGRQEESSTSTVLAQGDSVVQEANPVEVPTAILLFAPDEQEINRRRNLVRALFNDFWNGRDDKPTSFVDRLNEAESYLNERLAASGEIWKLDGEAREILGLPSRSNSHGKINGRSV
jgi:hypothetical protein